jgi:uncharacterized protein
MVFFAKSTYYLIKYKPSLIIGVGYLHLAIPSKLFRKPYIMLEDTEAAGKIINYMIPFVELIITNKYFKRDLGRKHLKIQSNLEFAYLHPNNFSPDKSVLDDLKLNDNDRFVFIRFVSWKAFHDVGQYGMSEKFKRKIVTKFLEYGKVFVSSESPLPEDLKKYQLNIPIQKIHSLEYFATLVFAESATITTESAILGTPSICISSFAYNTFGNFDELKEAGISFAFRPEVEELGLEKALEFLENPELLRTVAIKAQTFAKNHIDLTSFLYKIIKEYSLMKKGYLKSLRTGQIH